MSYCSSCKCIKCPDAFTERKMTCDKCRDRSAKNYKLTQKRIKENENLTKEEIAQKFEREQNIRVKFTKIFDKKDFDEKDFKKLMGEDRRKLSPSTIDMYLKSFNRIIEITNKPIMYNLEYSDLMIEKLTKELKSEKKVKNILKPLNYMLNNIETLDEFIGLYNTKVIKDYFKKVSEEELKEHIQKTNEVINHTFESLLAKVQNKYGADDKHTILYYLYDNITCRDDYGDLRYITNKNVSKKYNYIYHNPKNNNLQIILNVYKTSKVYGRLVFDITKHISNIITYINSKSLSHKDNFFDFDINGKFGKVINRINRECFDDLPKNSSINLLRHMISTERKDDPNLFKKMQHGQYLNLSYKRQYVPSDASDNDTQNNDDDNTI